jgi:hypothetical protein
MTSQLTVQDVYLFTLVTKAEFIMIKWAVNRNCLTTLLEFSGWEFEKIMYVLLLLGHRQTDR